MSSFKTYAALLFCFIVGSAFSVVLGQSNSPIADFQLSTRFGCTPLTVSITNLSSNAAQYEWDFGNGTSSTIAQPSVVYTVSGIYDITLIAKDAMGNSDTLLMQNAVTVNDAPVADFQHSITRACLQQNQISFTNLSTTGQNYIWDFGDGNSSTLENPVYSYANAGNYSVTLMVSDSIGCSSFKQASQPIQIKNAAALEFSVNDSIGCDTSQLFSFWCTTDSTVSWNWDFGDGFSSQLKNPTHRYQDTGQYTVRLIAVNQFGCIDTLEKRNYITIQKSVRPSFSASVNSGCAPLNVTFNVDTIHPGYNYSWQDGNAKTLSGNTVNALYDTAGLYSVRLVAQNNKGCTDTLLKTNYINVRGGQSVSFTVDSVPLCAQGAIQFTNTSANINARSFLWNFSDSTTSSSINLSHSFAQAGTYTVSLAATDTNNCTSTHSKSVLVRKLKADPFILSSSGCNPLTVSFVDSSSIADKWLWSFGDGDTSHQRSPIHTFVKSGKFDVTLFVETTSGCTDSVLIQEAVEVYEDTLSTSLTDTIEGCLPLPIDFSNNQLGVGSWLWDFGNGDTSMRKNPTYVYQEPGTYTVTLSTLSANGCPIFYENYATFKIDSIVPDMSVLFFDCSTRKVQFTDSTKNVSSWFWNFGDGTYSTLQSPTHQFPDTLVYDISLTVVTANGCSQSVFFPHFLDLSKCLVAGKTPVGFSGGAPSTNPSKPITTGLPLAQKCAPRIVQFTNPDSIAFAWHWDFGDGDTSILENPIHVYKTSGIFDVRVITHNFFGCDTTIWLNHVAVDGPLAEYSTSVMQDCDSAIVSFNNLSQRVQSWRWTFANRSDTSTVSPQHTFAYSSRNHAVHLKVKDSAGCQSSKISVFNFPPEVVSFDLPDSACVGNAVTFSATDSISTYQWSFGDGSTDSSFRVSHVYSNVGSYPVSVIRRSSLGCETTHYLDTIVVQGVSAEFTVLDSVNCVGSIFSFRPTYLSADTYLWKFDNTVMSHSQLPKMKLIQAGTYRVNLTVEKDGCKNSYTSATSVEVQGVDADIIVNQLNHCYPIQVSLADTNSKSVQWEWAIDSLKLNGVSQHTFTTNDDSLNISLKVTAQNGCVDSTSMLYMPSTLTSNFELSQSSGCAPLSVSFTNLAQHATFSYWSFGDGDTSTAPNPIHTYVNEGIYTVRLITSTADGCIDTTTIVDAINVSSVDADYELNYTTTCAPMMVNFKDKSQNATSWSWNFGDGTSSTNSSPLKVYHNSGDFDIRLIASNNVGCSDTLNVKNEIVVPGPRTKFSISDTSICGFSPVQFSDSSTNAVQWNWFFGDGSVSHQQNPVYTYTSEGTYSVTLTTTDSAGCSGFYTLPGKVKKSHNPSANFTLEDSVACTPFTVQVQADSSNATKWRWNISNGVTSQNRELNYSVQQAGSYSISLIVENDGGCQDTSNSKTILIYDQKNATVASVAPICSNEQPILLKATDNGGMWSGLGILDNSTGLYDPSVVKYGIDTVTYSFQGFCPTADTAFIQINEAPSVDFTVDNTEGCKELTSRFETVFLDTLLSGLEPLFSWKKNGQAFGDSVVVQHTFNPGIYTIDLAVQLPNGCSDSSTKTNLIKVYDSIPSQTNLKRVSVVDDHRVFLEWHKNSDIAFSYHKIYRKSSRDSIFRLIRTLSDQSITTFIDTVQSTLDTTYCYKIASVDKCGQVKGLDEIPFHCAVNVTAKAVGKDTVNVEWSEYIGCLVSHYEILRFEKTNMQGSLIATVGSAQLSFTDTTAYCNGKYVYKIKAVGPVGLQEGSFSDTSVALTEGVAHLQKSEIIRATVEENNSVNIEWTANTIKPEFAQGYVLHRSVDNRIFKPLTFIPKGVHHYNDRAVDVSSDQYFYKIQVLNSCPAELGSSGSSILLKATQTDDQSGKLNWTNYEKWDEGVRHFELQRLNELNQWETIKVLPPTMRSVRIDF